MPLANAHVLHAMQCCSAASAEQLLAFIKELREVDIAQRLLTITRAEVALRASVPRATRGTRVAALFRQARRERAAAQQELQVLVRAVRFARFQVQELHRPSTHGTTGALASHLLAYEAQLPADVLLGLGGSSSRSKASLDVRRLNMTTTQAQVARNVLQRFPQLFGQAEATALSATKKSERKALLEKLLSAPNLSFAETVLLKEVFGEV